MLAGRSRLLLLASSKYRVGAPGELPITSAENTRYAGVCAPVKGDQSIPFTRFGNALFQIFLSTNPSSLDSPRYPIGLQVYFFVQRVLLWLLLQGKPPPSATAPCWLRFRRGGFRCQARVRSHDRLCRPLTVPLIFAATGVIVNKRKSERI